MKVIKSDERLRKIPVVVLTTSKSPEDLSESYHMGANSYISKPSTFEGLVQAIQTLNIIGWKRSNFRRRRDTMAMPENAIRVLVVEDNLEDFKYLTGPLFQDQTLPV